MMSVEVTNALMQLAYRLLSYAQLALCVYWPPQCVRARAPSLSVPFRVDSLQLHRVVSVLALKPLYCRLLTR